jgi:glycosyltransferase involved in cell wall biosynthesis
MRYVLYTETFPHRQPEADRQTGIGRYCADLASGLVELGHDVVVLTNDEIGPGDSALCEPYRVEVLGASPQTRFDRWKRRQQVRARIAALTPDFLLVGDPLGHSVVAGWTGKSFPRVCPIFHGTELAVWGRMLRRGARSPRAAWRTYALRRYLRSAHTSICNSRFTLRLLHEFLPDSSRECVVYPCVSEMMVMRPVVPGARPELLRRLGPADGSATVLLTVARISDRKNQLGVIEALDRLTRSGAGSFHYAIVGNTDASEHRSYRQRLEERIETGGLSGRVTFIEGATEEDKIAYLDACDIFIMLSRTVGDSVEGFGISAIEASCRGRPVVVSDQGGMPETVLDGCTGFVVSPDHPARLTEILASLAKNRDQGHQMGEAGRRFVLENFTPRITASRLHEHLTRPPGPELGVPAGVRSG